MVLLLAALLTGRYQQRFGFYRAPDSRIGLPLSEFTLADLLKKEGYLELYNLEEDALEQKNIVEEYPEIAAGNFTVFLVFVLSLIVLKDCQALKKPEQPNIIFILADDLGAGDLHCTGHPYAMSPNLDKS